MEEIIPISRRPFSTTTPGLIQEQSGLWDELILGLNVLVELVTVTIARTLNGEYNGAI